MVKEIWNVFAVLKRKIEIDLISLNIFHFLSRPGQNKNQILREVIYPKKGESFYEPIKRFCEIAEWTV